MNNNKIEKKKKASRSRSSLFYGRKEKKFDLLQCANSYCPLLFASNGDVSVSSWALSYRVNCFFGFSLSLAVVPKETKKKRKEKKNKIK